MKNVINYYYQLNLENLHSSSGNYYFTYQNHEYMLTTYDKSLEMLTNLYALNQILLRQNPYYDQIILTKDKLCYILVDQKCYCLLKKSNVIHDTLSFYDLRFDSVSLSNSALQPLVRFPWTSFWEQKIDYIENILWHLDGVSPEIESSILYFIGLAENAISYVVQTVSKKTKTTQDHLFVSHHRIDSKASVSSYYNPLELVIDHPARDIAEYLNSLFFYNEYDWNDIEEYLSSIHFSEYGYALLFGRMLYPSFFFDTLDLYWKEQISSLELLKLSERRGEYQHFLKELYYLLKRKTNLEEVRWILRD